MKNCLEQLRRERDVRQKELADAVVVRRIAAGWLAVLIYVCRTR